MLLYNSIILPHLSYCSIVWGNSYSSHLNEIKLLQNKAIRIITDSEYKCSTNPLFIKMKVLPIQQLIMLNNVSSCSCKSYNDSMFVFKTVNVCTIFVLIWIYYAVPCLYFNSYVNVSMEKLWQFSFWLLPWFMNKTYHE